jgi:hypothetical protein
MTKNPHLGVDGHRWKAIRRLSGDQDTNASAPGDRVSRCGSLPSASMT